MKKNKTWCCFDCGKQYVSEDKEHIVTCHEGTCDVCGEVKTVTHIRAFNYLQLYCGR